MWDGIIYFQEYLYFFIILLTTLPFFIFSPHRAAWMMTLIIVLEIGKVAEFVNKSVIEVQKTTYYHAALISGTKIFGLLRNYYRPACFSQWISYFIQHMGTVLFLLGQLGFSGIFVSQKLVPMPGGFGGPTPYAIINTANVWPIYLANTTTDISWCTWVPISACVFITFAIFSFIALGKGVMQYTFLNKEEL